MSEKVDVQALYELYRTPKHVIAHCAKVAEVCEKMADAAIAKGHRIDKDMLMQAAHVHDALRVCDFRDFDRSNYPEVASEDFEIWKQLRKEYGAKGHAKALAEILTEMGSPKIGNLVAMHAFIKIDNLKTLEEKIIYYADKRVDLDKIAGLHKRLEEGKKRNVRDGEDDGLRQEIIGKIMDLEKEFEELMGDCIHKL